MATFSISRALREERAKNPARKLSKKIQEFYEENLTSPWQREKVKEIRALYEQKQRGLDSAHNIASSKLSEEFMEFELEYLMTSQRLKGEYDGMEPFHRDIRALWSRAFWKYVWKKLCEKVRFLNTAHG